VLPAIRASKFQEKVLPDCLQHCRWFGGKAHALSAVKIIDQMPLGKAATGADAGHLVFLETSYLDAAPETYVLPLQMASAAQAQSAAGDNPLSPVAQISGAGGDTVVFDALDDESFRSALLETIVKEKRPTAGRGGLIGHASAAFKEAMAEAALPLPSRALRAEQSNSSVIYDNRYFLKLYRKSEEGHNPDVELLRHLSERQKFPNVPAYCGSIDCTLKGGQSRSLALLVELVPNEGDAYSQTLDALGRYIERVLSKRPDVSDEHDPALLDELIGGVMPERIRLLGQRTAEMHLALAADGDDPDFAPEPFTTLYQRSLHQSMRGTTRRMIQVLRKNLPHIPEPYARDAAVVVDMENEILASRAGLLNCKISATKIRVHGDYHLGQVLSTGRDFVIIDFEGEPSRSIGERRMKRCPLRDVAGMLRSFDYAAHAAPARATHNPEEAECLQPWMDDWAEKISGIFLDSYYATTSGSSFIPEDTEIRDMLLGVYLLDKATYEVIYELNNRPEKVYIPLRGIRKILGTKKLGASAVP
jgi:maltose alpha-D-glucosyltransferase/alpha-amylase